MTELYTPETSESLIYHPELQPVLDQLDWTLHGLRFPVASGLQKYDSALTGVSYQVRDGHPYKLGIQDGTTTSEFCRTSFDAPDDSAFLEGAKVNVYTLTVSGKQNIQVNAQVEPNGKVLFHCFEDIDGERVYVTKPDEQIAMFNEISVAHLAQHEERLEAYKRKGNIAKNLAQLFSQIRTGKTPIRPGRFL